MIETQITTLKEDFSNLKADQKGSMLLMSTMSNQISSILATLEYIKENINSKSSK